MRTDTKKQFDWKGRLEQLEDRQMMSADPLGGLLGGAIEHHAIVDDMPALDHHALPPLNHHVESTPDFWIEPRDQYSENDSTRHIERTLEEAHGQTGLSNVRADYGFTGIGQTVAVIDSGIAYDHFALGGGFGSDYRVVGGWDFTGENDANPYDDGPQGSHGTHVAGIVGGDYGNDSGVAPGVDLVALRVFDDAGAGYFSWVENALDWIHTNRNSFENPITAVNLSLGVASWNEDSIPSWANLEDEFAQLEADGIFISVSAGNEFASYNTPGLSYPAASSYVVPVMSVDDSGSLSYFSQRHSRAIAAPGRWITSTVPDYVGNNNGITDDYATMSGTSMAAPYVAGASVLVREAMEFVGYTNINQDMIYDHMIATSDSFFDSATNQNYNRLNLEAAIDALMPADDFGSSLVGAYDLGSISSSMAMNGAITTLNDIDYFSFTAANTGTVTFEVTNTTHELTSSWIVNSPNSLMAQASVGDSVVVDVVAGQEYTVGYTTGKGLGYYDFDVTPESSFSYTDWGAVAFAELEGVNAVNDTWYRIEATSDGYLTVEGLFDGANGQVSLELYDANLTQIDTGNAIAGESRVDIYATAGDEFYVRVLGSNADVDFRLTNLVSINGMTVDVVGTAGDDSFAVRGSTDYTVIVNGVDYSFATVAISGVNFTGGNGVDSLTQSSIADLDLGITDIEQFVDFDAIGYSLKQDLQLVNSSSDYENWGGWGERWIASETSDWYFITATGEFYRWGGNNNLSTSNLIATLDTSFFDDTSLLSNAVLTEYMIESEAASLDSNYGFYSTGNEYYDWGGWGEKWFVDANSDWYFITPDGDLYQFLASGDITNNQLIASLSSSYHNDMTMLFNASNSGSSGDITAAAISQQLGLTTYSANSENWAGWNEKWVQSSSKQWYFITASGGLYRWTKDTDLQGNEFVAALNTTFYSRADLLLNETVPAANAIAESAAIETNSQIFGSQESHLIHSFAESLTKITATDYLAGSDGKFLHRPFASEMTAVDFALENLHERVEAKPKLDFGYDEDNQHSDEFFTSLDSALSDYESFVRNF